jgi:hypothetical protein
MFLETKQGHVREEARGDRDKEGRRIQVMYGSHISAYGHGPDPFGLALRTKNINRGCK